MGNNSQSWIEKNTNMTDCISSLYMYSDKHLPGYYYLGQLYKRVDEFEQNLEDVDEM